MSACEEKTLLTDNPPRRRLWREIAAILAVKVLLIGLAAYFVFGSSQRLFVDGAVMRDHFFNQQ